MATTFLQYRLSDGYLHNWLVAGPLAFPVPALDSSTNQQTNELSILRRFFEPDSGITEPPVDLGPLGSVTTDHPPITWRYYRCREDHYVDFSGFQQTCCYVRAWAYAQLSIPASQEIRFVLTTNGPADLWLNGQQLHRQEHFGKYRPRSVSIPSTLQPGGNEILIRFESAGVRETPHIMALQLVGFADTEAQVLLPTTIEPDRLEKRLSLERIVEKATLDCYVYGFLEGDRYNRNEPIPVHFAGDLEVAGEITFRLQSLAGDIFQEKTTLCKAGSVVELAKTFPLRTGPHHLALLPPAHEYYQKNIRFERKELFHIVRTPYSQRAELDAGRRAMEALDDAAQRRNGSLYCEIAKMALGRWEKVDRKILHRALQSVQQHHADSVVDLLGILVILMRFQKDASSLDEIRPSLEAGITGYRYWEDEDGGETEFASESRQLLYHTCEILAGQLLPDQAFQRTGKTGQWHRERGEALIITWMRQHGMYGFQEWDSPVAVEAMLAALSCLVDLASSDTVCELASVLMDKIFFGLAVNSFKGAYGSSKGQTDTASVLSARLECTSGISRLMWGMGNFNESILGTVSLACCQKYELPDAIRQIAQDPVNALWNQERHKWPAQASRPISSAAEMKSSGEVSKVTYKTQDFMLCCAQDYRPGQFGQREHIWQATLGPDAVVFVNHPTCMSEDDAHQPNLWVGNGMLPRAAQWGDVLIAIYKLPPEAWHSFTHAYFPTAAFDEYHLHSHWAFARKGKGYLALKATQGLEFITSGPTAFRELRSFGKENIWLCHMGQALLDGSFEDFQRRVLAMEVTSEFLSMRLKSLRGDQLSFGWQGPLLVDGQEQPLAGYRHVENPYCTADLPASQMEIIYQGRGLRLKFE